MPRIDVLDQEGFLPEAFPIKASDHPTRILGSDEHDNQ
jgi:hypothetical protein